MGKTTVGCHPFPTTLIDAIGGYNYLAVANGIGYTPENIIIEIEGDWWRESRSEVYS